MVIFGILTMPKTISSIFVPAGSVALFFVLASWILILNHKDSDRKFGAFVSNNESVVLTQKDKSPELVRKDVISEKSTPSSGKSDGLQHTGLLPFGPGGSLDVASLPNKEKADEINQVAPLGEHAGGSGGDAGNVNIDSTEKSIPTLSLSNQTCLFESGNF